MLEKARKEQKDTDPQDRNFYGFTARTFDGSDLYHYRSRQYIPDLGIFAQSDWRHMAEAARSVTAGRIQKWTRGKG